MHLILQILIHSQKLLSCLRAIMTSRLLQHVYYLRKMNISIGRFGVIVVILLMEPSLDAKARQRGNSSHGE